VAAVVVVVVDRAVRSAGKRLASSENWGRSDAAPVVLKCWDLRDQGLRQSRLCL
jgi:hypothetical protein